MQTLAKWSILWHSSHSFLSAEHLFLACFSSAPHQWHFFPRQFLMSLSAWDWCVFWLHNLYVDLVVCWRNVVSAPFKLDRRRTASDVRTTSSAWSRVTVEPFSSSRHRSSSSWTPNMIWSSSRAGWHLSQHQMAKSAFSAKSLKSYRQSSTFSSGRCILDWNCLRHTRLFLPALHRSLSSVMVAVESLSWRGVKPDRRTAWRMLFNRQDSRIVALYSARMAPSSSGSIFKRVMLISH